MNAYKRNQEKEKVRKEFSKICPDEVPTTLEQKYYNRLISGDETIDVLVPPETIIDEMVLIKN